MKRGKKNDHGCDRNKDFGPHQACLEWNVHPGHIWTNQLHVACYWKRKGCGSGGETLAMGLFDYGDAEWDELMGQ